jgi:N-formylglutamate amidohydrolase
MGMKQGHQGGGAPFTIEGPALPASPVVVGVPHSGRDYPPALIAMARVRTEALTGLEDRLADRIAEAALAEGATLVVAQTARAMIDLNRDPGEIDLEMVAGPMGAGPVMATSKMRAGLGLFPRRLPMVGELWRRKLEPAEAAGRIARIHGPYHDAIGERLDAAQAVFGVAILVDCHSMPPLSRNRGEAPARIVVGDLYGRAADPALIDLVIETIEGRGIDHARNAPYAGGHALQRHGDPRRGRSAIQIEFDRTLYLDAQGKIDPMGLAECRSLFGLIVARLADAARGRALPLAAE